MTHDDNTDELEVEEQDEETETVEETESEVEVEEESQSEETEIKPEVKLTYEEKLAAAKTDAEKFAIANAEAAKNRRLLNKKVAPPTAIKPVVVKKPTSSPSSVDVDERILLANGMPPQLLKELKKVAKVTDKGLIEAQNDTIFVAVKEKFEKEQKSKKASIGGSRGSGTAVVKKDAKTPGLSRDEHRQLAEAVL